MTIDGFFEAFGVEVCEIRIFAKLKRLHQRKFVAQKPCAGFILRSAGRDVLGSDVKVSSGILLTDAPSG